MDHVDGCECERCVPRPQDYNRFGHIRLCGCTQCRAPKGMNWFVVFDPNGGGAYVQLAPLAGRVEADHCFGVGQAIGPFVIVGEAEDEAVKWPADPG